MSRGVVQVWEQADGRWRWSWRDGAGEEPLVSHMAFDTEQGAWTSARASYPELFADHTVDEPSTLLRVVSRVALLVAVVGRARGPRAAR